MLPYAQKIDKDSRSPTDLPPVPASVIGTISTGPVIGSATGPPGTFAYRPRLLSTRATEDEERQLRAPTAEPVQLEINTAFHPVSIAISCGGRARSLGAEIGFSCGFRDR
jgi:hypothetical protein